MSPYRTAIIGCGGRGRAHMSALSVEPRYKVAALCDLSPKAAERAKADFGFGDASLWTDHGQMVDEVKPDLVIISLWTAQHLPVLKDCVAAGAQIIHAEKPIAPTWGECLDTKKLVKESGVQLTFSHQRRFAEGNLLARQWMKEGKFGKPLRLDLFSPPHLLDCGTHTFDQAMSMLDEAPGKWIMASADTSTQVNYFNVPAEGVCTASLVFANGVRASIQCGGPDMDLWGGLRMTGEKGFFEIFWDGELREVRLYDDPDFKAPEVKADGEAQMRAMITHILDCYEAGIESEVSLEKAMRAAEIIFTGYESIRRRERLEIPAAGFTDNPIHSILTEMDRMPEMD